MARGKPGVFCGSGTPKTVSIGSLGLIDWASFCPDNQTLLPGAKFKRGKLMYC